MALNCILQQNKKILTILLSLALIIVFFHSIFLSEIEYNVLVTNGFTNNSSMPLVIWCISSEDMDIGGRALQEGDDYSWTLKTKRVSLVFWACNYRCTMKWDDKRKKFYAFKFRRDFHRCGPLSKCSWLVKEDGFYFSNDDVVWNKDFSWS